MCIIIIVSLFPAVIAIFLGLFGISCHWMYFMLGFVAHPCYFTSGVARVTANIGFIIATMFPLYGMTHHPIHYYPVPSTMLCISDFYLCGCESSLVKVMKSHSTLDCDVSF